MLGVDPLMVNQNPSFNLRFIIPFRELVRDIKQIGFHGIYQWEYPIWGMQGF